MCKNVFHLLSLVLVLAIGSVAHAGLAEWEAAVSDANPLHWYKFDETGTDCIDSGSGALNGVYDGVVMGQEGLLGLGTAVGFERTGANRADFANASDLPGPWTVEYIVKTTKASAANDSQALHDGDSTSVRLAGWTALGEVGFTLYGVADYVFTPIAGYTLDDLIIKQGEWVHLTWRNDGVGIQFFLNGKLVGTSSDTIDLPRLRIGGRGAGPADHLQGVLDEAVVFDRSLSNEDIVAHSAASTLLDPSVLGAGSPDPADGVIHADTWVSLGWSAGGTAVSHDVYFSDNLDDVINGTPGAPGFRGNQATTTLIAGFVGFPFPEGLVPGTTYYWRVDEVAPEDTYRGQVWSFLVPPRTAYFPDPIDGAEFVDLDATLTWTAGFGAKLHTVYLGDSFEDVNNATGGSAQGAATFVPASPLESEKVYYWRVDEFDIAATHKGDIWRFTTPGAVGNPQPTNGAVDVQILTTLGWTPADTATSNDLYFGTDADAVKNATSASPEYIGNKALGSESHDPGKLALGATYYWLVDAVYPDKTVKGLLWSLTTADFIGVDDFEAYNDIDPPDPNSNRIFDKWLDGFGTTTNGALIGNDLPPYAGQTVVHSGAQSMPYFYDNNLKTSEATLTLVYPKDWTQENVTRLSLWFRGDSANAAQRMFVALNGTAVVYHDDAAPTQITGWTEWIIDLTEFAGLDLTNVNTITIGFGTKNSPAAGGSGQMYFDDIRLYRPASE